MNRLIDCPAGGQHSPTNDVGPEHEHLPAYLRWHCDECGQSLRPPEREGDREDADLWFEHPVWLEP